MDLLPWLLLPVAAAAGWISAWKRGSDKAANETKPDLSDQYIQGLNYLLNEQPDKAIEALINVVDVDHETVNTHLVLGALFRRRGEVDRAIRIHQNVIARPSLTAEQRENAMIELGTDYFKAGVLDRAEGIFRKMSENKSVDLRVYKSLQNIYEREKEWAKAIKVSQQLRQLDDKGQAQKIAQYYCEMAELEQAENRSSDAHALLRKSLDSDPRCLRAHLLQGDVYALQHKLDKAEASFRKIGEINRGFASLAYDRLFSLYAEQGELKQLQSKLEQDDFETNAAARYTMLRIHTVSQDERAVRDFLHQELSRPNASPMLVKRYLQLMQESTDGDVQKTFTTLYSLLDSELSTYRSFRCTSCGYDTNTLFWNCPTCRKWDTSKPNRYLSIEYGHDLD